MTLSHILIGIDDTDNLDSRGTGYTVRELGRLLQENHLANYQCVSRHQLYFHPNIPYTSHNSSACLEIVTENIENVKIFSRDYMLGAAAIGSDVGLCIASFDSIPHIVVKWGKRAKSEILTQNEALSIAQSEGIYLEGLTGTQDGIIGSLAAIGLRKDGNDGRILMLDRDFRSFTGRLSGEEICKNFHIQNIFDIFGLAIPMNELIHLEQGWKPVLQNGKYTLIVEKESVNGEFQWKSISKDLLRKISS